jgi:isoleucyl-tRNA synthetase
LRKDDEIIEYMTIVRSIVNSGLAIRKEHGIKVRQPLQKLTVFTKHLNELKPLIPLMKRELNLKEIEILSSKKIVQEDYGISKGLTIFPRILGPRIGKDVQKVIQNAKAGNWEETSSGISVQAGDITFELLPTEYEIKTVVHTKNESEAIAILQDGFLILDLNITEDLENEGIARDFLRNIQEARKGADFNISQRINLDISTSERNCEALREHVDLIAKEALVNSITISNGKEKITVSAAD